MKKSTKKKLKTSLIVLLIISILVVGIYFLFDYLDSSLKAFILGIVAGLKQDVSGDNNSNNDNTDYSCIDSDGGLSFYMVGHATDQDDEVFYDKCASDERTLTEYYCSNDRVTERVFSCPSGYKCMQTRSGGKCLELPTWSEGDTVFDSGFVSGSLTGDDVAFAELDLSDYGFTTDGTCRLGAIIQTSWDYGNNYCQGLQGAESIKWDFYDSNGLEYTRTDLNPTSLGVDLHPEIHILNWNGETNWRGEMSKILGLPDCEIDYEYNIKIYIYDC